MDVEKEIKELNRIELKIHKQKDQDGRLPGAYFEKYLSKREAILQHFGLPETLKYARLLELGKSELTQEQIEETITKLHQAAQNYLLSSAQTDEQTLQDAKEQKRSSYHVLAEIGIEQHIYTIFVYKEIFLKEQDTIENVLQTLRMVNRDDILSHLGKVQYGNSEESKEAIQELKNMEIPYLDAFQEYVSQTTL